MTTTGLTKQDIDFYKSTYDIDLAGVLAEAQQAAIDEINEHEEREEEQLREQQEEAQRESIAEEYASFSDKPAKGKQLQMAFIKDGAGVTINDRFDYTGEFDYSLEPGVLLECHCGTPCRNTFDFKHVDSKKVYSLGINCSCFMTQVKGADRAHSDIEIIKTLHDVAKRKTQLSYKPARFSNAREQELVLQLHDGILHCLDNNFKANSAIKRKYPFSTSELTVLVKGEQTDTYNGNPVFGNAKLIAIDDDESRYKLHAGLANSLDFTNQKRETSPLFTRKLKITKPKPKVKLATSK